MTTQTGNVFGYTITVSNDYEAEVQCPVDYRFEHRETFRVVLLNPSSNDPTFSVALPGMGDFKLAYRWIFSYPARKCGPAGIAKRMTGNFNLYTADQHLAQVIYWAGRMVWEMRNANQPSS